MEELTLTVVVPVWLQVAALVVAYLLPGLPFSRWVYQFGTRNRFDAPGFVGLITLPIWPLIAVVWAITYRAEDGQ